MKTFAQARQLANRMLAERRQRYNRWRQLSRWICPQRGLFERRQDRRQDDGELLLFTQVPSQACLAGASGLTSGMTPRNASWFKPDFRHEELRELPGARDWLDRVDHLMRNCLAFGGFYQAIHSFNMDLIWSGCALLYAEDSREAGEAALRYECPQVGTWAVARNSAGELDKVLRCVVMSLDDMDAVFGRDALDRDMAARRQANPLETKEVWQLVCMEEGGAHPAQSYWWLPGGRDFLRVGGYREMPFFYTCWYEGATVYGTGPGDEALPDARQIDILERHKLEGLAKIVNPPVAAPNHLKGHCNLAAGAVNYVADRTVIAPILDLGSFAASLPHLREEIAFVTQRIERSLLAAIFNSMPLTARPPGMSATEFMERKREVLQQLGPVISAYEPHVLTPLLFRTLQALNYNCALPPAPESFGPNPLEVTLDFISPMANALRQSTAESSRALLLDVANIVKVTGEASVLDKLDLDQMVDEYATGLGAPGSIVRADADVAALRQQREQARAQAEALAMRQQMNDQAMGEAQALQAQAQAALSMQAASAQDEEAPINLLAGRK